jgi:hypothetical protein
MKINEKLEFSLMDENHFYLITFHPAGEPEASICCVIKGEA